MMLMILPIRHLILISDDVANSSFNIISDDVDDVADSSFNIISDDVADSLFNIN
jgi:hypothetical protein